MAAAAVVTDDNEDASNKLGALMRAEGIDYYAIEKRHTDRYKPNKL